jgi:hypothetical protein
MSNIAVYYGRPSVFSSPAYFTKSIFLKASLYFGLPNNSLFNGCNTLVIPSAPEALSIPIFSLDLGRL